MSLHPALHVILDKVPSVAGATFVGMNSRQGDGALTLPVGWAAGDVAIIIIVDTTGPSGPADPSGYTNLNSWTSTTTSRGWTVCYRVLAGGDSDPTISGTNSGGAAIFVWRGATAATHKNTNAGSTSASPSWTGITKNASSKKVIVVAGDDGKTTSETAPPGFTNHIPSSITFFSFVAADVDPSGYTDGAAATFGSFGTGQKTGSLVELT